MIGPSVVQKIGRWWKFAFGPYAMDQLTNMPPPSVPYGWFDEPDQVKPSYDPPLDACCLCCGRPIARDDVQTVSLMWQSPAYAKRSYFYRRHKTCALKHPEFDFDGVILDMIELNGD